MLKKLWLGAAALILGLACTSEATAQGFRPGPFPDRLGRPGPIPGRIGGPLVRPYYETYGVRFGGGYYYRGAHHNHWSRRVWDPRFCRYHYWDPHLRCYYYWSAPRGCFLPVHGFPNGGFGGGFGFGGFID